MIARLGQACEFRQFRQREIHAERAGAAAVVQHALAKIGRQKVLRDKAREQEFRIEVRDDGARAEAFALSRGHTDSLALFDDHFRHAVVRRERHAFFRASLRHRLCDRAHAADRMSPHALAAVRFAEEVMQQHIGRARRVGRRVIADNGVEAQHRLDRIAFEPAIEHVAGRLSEQGQEIAPGRHVETGKVFAEPGTGEHLAEGGDPAVVAHVWRRAQKRRAHQLGQRRHPFAVGVNAFCVAQREFGDFSLGATAAGNQIVPVVQRKEVLRQAIDDAKAMPLQLKIGDDLGIEQRDRVGRDRIAKARMEFFRDRRAAHHVAPLDNAHFQSCRREIVGADEAVMPRADDEDVGVVLSGHG